MFRFTIRELVLLTLVVGLAVGWWLDRSALRSDLLRLSHEVLNVMVWEDAK